MSRLKLPFLSLRLNIPAALHLQTGYEERLNGIPFFTYDKDRRSFHVGDRFFQLTGSEGRFLLLEVNQRRFQIGSTALTWSA